MAVAAVVQQLQPLVLVVQVAVVTAAQAAHQMQLQVQPIVAVVVVVFITQLLARLAQEVQVSLFLNIQILQQLLLEQV
jgi:hypothetical protein